MKSICTFAVLSIFISSLNSCLNKDTPQYRIEKNPQVYEALPIQQKELVEKGEIDEGMSKHAVFLAWGYPNTQPLVGQDKGKSMTRWIYTRLEPVAQPYFWGGPEWSPYGWYAPNYFNTLSLIPQNAATVSFEDGKVVSWSKGSLLNTKPWNR